MKLGLVFTINAIVATAFAIPLLLIPGSFLPMYAVETTPGALLLARFFGSALAAFGVVTWLVRALPEDSAGVRAVVVALAVSNTLGFVVALIARLEGVGNAMGWSTVVIYLFFAACYAMAAIRKPGAAAAT